MSALTQEMIMEPLKPLFDIHFESPPAWWPADLGSQPSAVGGANGERYAYFAASQRLVIERHGSTDLFDTTGHEIRGFSQDTSRASGLVIHAASGDALEVLQLRRLG